MKYLNKPTFVDGIRFASKAEADRYGQLKLLERQGKISCLKLQPKYQLQTAFFYNGKNIRAITYAADFSYIKSGIEFIDDVKGKLTDHTMDKIKMFVYLFLRDLPNTKFTLIYKGQSYEYPQIPEGAKRIRKKWSKIKR